jgi:hypothetical protein
MGPIDLESALTEDNLELVELAFTACVVYMRFVISTDQRKRSGRRRALVSRANAPSFLLRLGSQLNLLARRPVPGPARPLARGAAVAHGEAGAALLQVGAFLAAPIAFLLLVGCR